MTRCSSESTEGSEDAPIEVSLSNGTTVHPVSGKPQPEKPTNIESRAQSARSRKQQNFEWKQFGTSGSQKRPVSDLKYQKTCVSSQLQPRLSQTPLPVVTSEKGDGDLEIDDKIVRRSRFKNSWNLSLFLLVCTLIGMALLVGILRSAASHELDPKGCRMSFMRPSYKRLHEFDTEHTRFASKYSLYLYRENGIDDETKVRGVPVLFIPGNAGSYKQVRPIASEAAQYFQDTAQRDPRLLKLGVRNLDFFTADFNEDITAFHGQTLLDQAEYLNEAIRYILSLYLDPRSAERDPGLPDPISVIILGHSMGGVVARTMLVMPNYQERSINTILTMSAPHARPPVAFDSEIVRIYNEINNYWRNAYSQQWANDNPLWHVTLVSVAGGGLDTVVPSDYASIESLIPATHGFTVFTTTIPTVWTSMDHQAILWCDQFRKVVAKALYDIVDVNRSSQTKPRAERMRAFKKYFLTGMERIAEKSLPTIESFPALSVQNGANKILPQGDRLVLSGLGSTGKPEPYLLPIPPQDSPGRKHFTLLTNKALGKAGTLEVLDVLACSVYPLQQSTDTTASIPVDMVEGSVSSKLACRSVALDVISLPASTSATKYPFYREKERPIIPFSYLQYDAEELSDYQFIAVLDKANKTTSGFVVAEFSDRAEAYSIRHDGLQRLLTYGLSFTLPSRRPMVEEIKIPSLKSSLLSYKLSLDKHGCAQGRELFQPLIRQYFNEPYESKFYVNAKDISISLHGIAPYVPPPMVARDPDDGLNLQFWTDPTCGSTIRVNLEVDLYGSLGKLSMRYRTVFGAFPLLIVVLVLRKQFRVYDQTGVFIAFSESLDSSLRRHIPTTILALTSFSLFLGQTFHREPRPISPMDFWNTTGFVVDYGQNDLLVGTTEPFFWFITPLIAIVCVGVCAVLHYAVLLLTLILSTLYSWAFVRPGWVRNEDRRIPVPTFLAASPRRRIITTALLLIMVATVIPYQFAYLVACLVQLTTTIRAHRLATDMRTPSNYNFYNYAHSILILMLWVLPINLPILVVWIKNLAVHWLTPFSSHHNVVSIMPFILLVETLISGKMIPRITSRLSHVVSVLFFVIALWSGVYGVSYAYTLHYLVNALALWLVAVHSTTEPWLFSGIESIVAGIAAIFDWGFEDAPKRSKDP